MRCEDCRNALNRTSANLARDVEQSFPDCECERYSVGQNSPGKIADHEILYRMFVDPVDVDDQGRLAREALYTAYVDGLSIIRECAEDTHVEALVSDILSVRPGGDFKTIRAIFKFVCITVRREMINFKGADVRAFCVYDQTTPRILDATQPPVPTHGIVLSRRLTDPPRYTRKQFEADCNNMLHRLVAAEAIPVQGFRRGLIDRLNQRSLLGEFVRA
jgi:hypothetical protein